MENNLNMWEMVRIRITRLKCVGSSLDIWESIWLSMLDIALISSKRLKYLGNDLDIWEMD